MARIDRFLEKTTLVDHALVFQQGFILNGPRTYDILDGAPPKEVAKRQVDWPTGAMDRSLAEHGFAFMLCSQELHPGQFTSSNVVHVGAKFRCALNAIGEDGSKWTATLADRETAAVVGLLGDGWQRRGPGSHER